MFHLTFERIGFGNFSWLKLEILRHTRIGELGSSRQIHVRGASHWLRIGCIRSHYGRVGNGVSLVRYVRSGYVLRTCVLCFTGLWRQMGKLTAWIDFSSWGRDFGPIDGTFGNWVGGGRHVRAGERVQIIRHRHSAFGQINLRLCGGFPCDKWVCLLLELHWLRSDIRTWECV